MSSQKACLHHLYGFQMEREMCSASAEFEDFVLQFMDRYVEYGQVSRSGTGQLDCFNYMSKVKPANFI